MLSSALTMTFGDLLLLAIGAYVAMMVYALIRLRNIAAFLFIVVLVMTIAWDLTYYLELTLDSLPTKIGAHLARFIFLPWLPILWLAMIRSLLGIGKGLPRWLWVGVIMVNVIAVITALTSPWHHLFHYNFAIHGVGGCGILVFDKGIIYRIYEFVQYVLGLLTIILMIRAWPGASPIMRRQLPPLILGFVVPLVMNILWSTGVSPVSHVNLAPFTTLISIGALAWVVLGYRALDIVPVARGVLLDHMNDLVFVADRQGRLVDLNAAALREVQRPLMECMGKSASALPIPWNRVFEGDTGVREFVIAGTCKWFDVALLDIRDKRGKAMGRLCMLRDVSVQYREEQARQKRQMAYQKLLEEKKYLRQQELLIRDLHDGIGGLVAGIAMISAIGLKEQDILKREVLMRRIMELAAEANVEIRSLMNTLESRELLWPDVIVEMRRHGVMFQDNHGIAFQLVVQGEGDVGGPGLFAGMSLFRIFKEALTNIAKHSDADSATVQLIFEDRRLCLIVRDNGHGMPQVPPMGRGLRNMRQRITELGGTMTVGGGAGTELRFEAPLPLKSPDDAMTADEASDPVI